MKRRKKMLEVKGRGGDEIAYCDDEMGLSDGFMLRNYIGEDWTAINGDYLEYPAGMRIPGGIAWHNDHQAPASMDGLAWAAYCEFKDGSRPTAY